MKIANYPEFKKQLLSPAFATLDAPLDAAARALPSMPINTVEELQVTLDAIEYRGGLGLMRARVVVHTATEEGFAGVALLSVPDRTILPMAPATIDVGHYVAFMKPIYATTLLHVVRDTFARLLLHELAESITVHGIRLFDPH